ncbi:hypothetical protein [Deinococcus sp.]|uniref:hypothetical protein n=1 Tax=Deinococcus sp. TaxID=47478 RepID=UPI002869CD9E|nr:hypothetical protein [Deinococcus sp.]
MIRALALAALGLPGSVGAQAVELGNVVVVWGAAAQGDVAGTVMLRCQASSGGCGPDSWTQRVAGAGRYAVFKWKASSDGLNLLWRDVNRNAAIDAGDELARLDSGSLELVRLARFDGNWRAFLGEQALDDLYQSNTMGAVPVDGPFPTMVKLPARPGPVQPTDTAARGSLNGSWVLWAAFPTALAPERSWASPNAVKADGQWPLQVLAFQDREKGRYVYQPELGSAPAECGLGSGQRLKVEGQFTSAGGTLTLRDTARTMTTTCVKAAAQGTVSAATQATCTQAVATVPAAQRKQAFDLCASALSGDGGPKPTVQKQPLDTHSYRFRRFDTFETPDVRSGRNLLLFLEDAQGNVFLYVRQ